MSFQDDSNIAIELDVRLDEIFGEDGEHEGYLENENPEGLADSPIKDLKTIVLSLDWEITDEDMERLSEEISKLNDLWKDDSILLVFLQILDAVGKHIRTRKNRAHPGSIGLLNSAYKSMQEVVLSEDMSEAEKKKILNVELDKFNELKEEIVRTKADGREKSEPAPVKAKEIDEEYQAIVMEDLGAIVLSLELEITEQIMERFNAETEKLKAIWKDHKTLFLFVQLLSGVGKYIGSKRNEAHPNSMELLSSVYNSMEKSVLSHEMSEKEKEKIFNIELDKFNRLKEEIAQTKASVPEDVVEERKEGGAFVEPEDKIEAEEDIIFEEVVPHAFQEEEAIIPEEEDIEVQETAQEEDVVSELIVPDAFQEDEAIITEKDIESELMVPDVLLEVESVNEEEELEFQEVNGEDETAALEIAATETLTGHEEAAHEDTPPVKKRGKRRFWFFGRRKKKKEDNIPMEIQETLEEGEELPLPDLDIQKDQFTTEEAISSDYFEENVVSKKEVEDMNEVAEEVGYDTFVEEEPARGNEEPETNETVVEEEYGSFDMITMKALTGEELEGEVEQQDTEEIILEDEYDNQEMTKITDTLLDGDEEVSVEDETALPELPISEYGDDGLEGDGLDTVLEGDEDFNAEDETALPELSIIDDGDDVQEDRGLDTVFDGDEEVSVDEETALTELSVDEGKEKNDLASEIETSLKMIEDDIMDQDVEAALPELPVEEDPVVPDIVMKEAAAEDDSTIEEVTEDSNRPEHEPSSIDISNMTPHEAFAFGLEGMIRNTIKAEFNALRAELKLWREGK